LSLNFKLVRTVEDDHSWW